MLTDRQLHLLNVIVEDFVDSGSPIGSKKLIEQHNLNVSPATIRAEMKRLEDHGLIEKMHSSSGRIPSEAGYKFYVEALQNEFPYEENFFIDQTNFVDFRMLAKDIAMDTQYLSIATTTEIDKRSISQIHLTYLTPTNLVLIIVYENGNVEHQQISWQVRLTRQEIERMNNYLNQNLLAIIEGNIHLDVNHQGFKQLPLSHLKSEIVKKAHTTSHTIYFEGREYLYEIIDSDNLNAVKETLKLIDSDDLPGILSQVDSDHIQVTLGQEIDKNLEGISIVTSPIHLHNMNGKIAVIGPTQMSYRKVFNKLASINHLL
ncbi:heat-inducible transcriptional repressor HrcA [Macrococcoides bohemicum]|uniref:Heat-inducible transcription repressor HrcA n=1 Tax=Macrococcoides bohemicum TaxID=1903056 RepID=A0A328A757_9STAP|nr:MULTISPECIES: heat-inducible transcriptional repressor HrcA [Macrococcus]ATD30165.1 heat-inducible transcription repressor HrcA [Macrococcus sp. IME1552]QRN50128.1 heat-inducible transcription repressor HrcA [Macrococcus bohemicus]QYA41560.1 heat-inducible transcriptional repressor HrcA [Macrococcus bohemicus]QYA43985.1 heat-inducible transcriptional repressor HrcA [Macrococcus bohemicus]RAK50309.1 heat-inducible transcription repressor HrcA [Macrococcus bohemicus]